MFPAVSFMPINLPPLSHGERLQHLTGPMHGMWNGQSLQIWSNCTSSKDSAGKHIWFSASFTKTCVCVILFTDIHSCKFFCCALLHLLRIPIQLNHWLCSDIISSTCDCWQRFTVITSGILFLPLEARAVWHFLARPFLMQWVQWSGNKTSLASGLGIRVGVTLTLL